MSRVLAAIITVILTLSICIGCAEKVENKASQIEPAQVSASEQSKPKSGSIIIKVADQTEENPANNLEIVFGNGIKLRPKEKITETQVPLFQLNEWHSITVLIDDEEAYPANFYLPENDDEPLSVLVEDGMVVFVSRYIEGEGVAYERIKAVLEEKGNVT